MSFLHANCNKIDVKFYRFDSQSTTFIFPLPPFKSNSKSIKSVETSFAPRQFLTEMSTIFHRVAGFIVSTREFPLEIISWEKSERNLNGPLVELLKYSRRKISSNSFSLMNVYAFVMVRRKISKNQHFRIFQRTFFFYLESENDDIKFTFLSEVEYFGVLISKNKLIFNFLCTEKLNE